MDLKGSLVDTNLRIFPSKPLLEFLENLKITGNTPANVLKFATKNDENGGDKKKNKSVSFFFDDFIAQLTNKEVSIINQIKATVTTEEPIVELENGSNDIEEISDDHDTAQNKNKLNADKTSKKSEKDDDLEKNKEDNDDKCNKPDESDQLEVPYLLTSDIDWLYSYIKTNKSGKYLHELLQGCVVKLPENEVIKRNPILEARCVKLRAQQDARDYRKMTKSVDNVRINYPEDSIAYQMKQINRQLIAIGQFIISIFAGFLFGFRGVEWMVGNLDFGFRLLLGVMCALIIALAEIYFLAKKLNEELAAVETTQIGGPPKFGDEVKYDAKVVETVADKEHQD